MSKFHITFMLVGLFTLNRVVECQRYFVTNQYVYDLFLVNPAAAVIKSDCFNISAYAQNQWLGNDKAPYTQILAFQKAFRSSVGIGTYIYNDRNGYTKEIGAQQTFASKVVLSHSRRTISRLLFGLSLMMNQRSIETTEFGDAGALDPSIAGSANASGYGFNANSGIMLTINSWQFGFSATNIFPYNNTIYSDISEPKVYMDMNYHVSTFYKVPKIDLYVEPMLFYRRNGYQDSRTDFSAKVTIPTSDRNVTFWGLLAYRRFTDHQFGTSLGSAITAGVFVGGFKVGVEYQLGLTNARQDFGNFYELILGYSFCRDRRRDALACPEDFKRNRKRMRK